MDEALAEVPTNNLLGVVAAERDWCGWALAATDGLGAIGRSTRPHLLFLANYWVTIFHAASGTMAGRWLQRMAATDAPLVRVYLSLSLLKSLSHDFSRGIRDDRTVLAESIQSNR